MDDMNNFGSWAQSFKYYEQLRAMVDMNDFELWAYAFRCNE